MSGIKLLDLHPGRKLPRDDFRAGAGEGDQGRPCGRADSCRQDTTNPGEWDAVTGLLLPHHITQRGNRRKAISFEDGDQEIYRDLLAEQTRTEHPSSPPSRPALPACCGGYDVVCNAIHNHRTISPYSHRRAIRREEYDGEQSGDGIPQAAAFALPHLK